MLSSSSSSASSTPRAMSVDEKATLEAATFFNTVVDSYIEAANTRFVPATFFIRKHGETGIERAQELKFTWRYIQINLENGLKDDAIDKPYLYLLAELKRVLADKKMMPGKYKRHSLKTYLLAYYSALNDWDAATDIKSLYETQLARLQAQPANEIQAEYEDRFIPELNQSTYQPSQLFQITIYELCHKMRLTNIADSNLDGNIDFCDFERPDKMKVRLYYPVSSLVVKEWVAKYGEDMATFSDKCIVIIPILQEKNNKKYFNIVAIRMTHIYNIYSFGELAAKLSGMLDMDAVEEIQDVIYDRESEKGSNSHKDQDDFNEEIKIKNIYVDQQSIFNEMQDGQYQINYAIILACLPVPAFESRDIVKATLETSKLSHREDDEFILSHYRYYRSSLVGASADELSFFVDMDETIKKEKQQRHTYALNEAKNAIQSYIDRATTKGSGHLHVEMANFLKEKLEEKLDERNRLDLVKKAIDGCGNEHEVREMIDICMLDEKDQIGVRGKLNNDKLDLFVKVNKLYVKKVTIEKLLDSNFAECALLLSCYDSISDKSSGLRLAVAFGLLCMLNAERDYKKTLEPVFDRAPDSLSGYFNECLRLASQHLYGGGMVDEYKMMKEDMAKWESVNTSLYSRLIEKKDEREKHHEEMKGDDQQGLKKVFEDFKKDLAKAKGRRPGKIEAKVYHAPRV